MTYIIVLIIVIIVVCLFLYFNNKRNRAYTEFKGRKFTGATAKCNDWSRATYGGMPAHLPPHKAKIVKCESDMWYKDKIGEEIEIASFGTFGMHTIDGKYVIFNDVEFVE